MTSEEQKILEVEIALDGFRVYNCHQVLRDLKHGESSGIILTIKLSTRLYIMPCRQHLQEYLNAGWKIHQ